jgi:hypothetical protein
MKAAQVQFKTVGMQRDNSVSAFNKNYAYENKNIRIMATNSNTLLSITNEKGPKDTGITFEGIPIGQAVINEYYVLFTTDDNGNDKIYRFKIEGSNITSTLLFGGNLGFNTSNPIETLVSFENEDVIKVYWTDGENQPRVINIIGDYTKFNSNSFDFVPSLTLYEKVTIEKNYNGNGFFNCGVIQYVCTYFNLYGQESAIFYHSPLYYIDKPTRGGSPEENASLTFKITIDNVDTEFSYVRVYSILRTTKDSTPDCRIVEDRYIEGETSVTITDTGNGSSIDATTLLYKSGDTLSAYTMEQKDNTLFLGNIETKNTQISEVASAQEIRNLFLLINEDDKDNIIENPITWDTIQETDIEISNELKGTYLYSSQLKYSSDKLRIFKYLEYYRLGVQFQHKTGKWSEVIYLTDSQNTSAVRTYKMPYLEDESVTNPFYAEFTNTITKPVAELDLNQEALVSLRDKLLAAGYIKIRPVVVYPSISERACICQGALCPTVYFNPDREDNSPYVQSSWFFRPNAPYDIDSTSFSTINDPYVLGYESRKGFVTNGIYKLINVRDEKGNDYTVEDNDDNIVNDTSISEENQSFDQFFNFFPKGEWIEFRHNKKLPGNTEYNCEIQNYLHDSYYTTSSGKYKNVHFVDQSIVTLHSPDLEFEDSIGTLDLTHAKLRIIGVIPLTGNIFDKEITASSSVVPKYADDTTSSNTTRGFQKYGRNTIQNISPWGYRSIITGGFWQDGIFLEGAKSEDYTATSANYVVYPWQKSGSLMNYKAGTGSTVNTEFSILQYNRLSNLRFSYSSIYFTGEDNSYTFPNGIADVKYWGNDAQQVLRLTNPNENEDQIIYYGDVDRICPISDREFFLTVTSLGAKIYYNESVSHAGSYIANIGYDIDREVAGKPTFLTDTYQSNESSQPVRLQYKSSTHAVIVLNNTNDKQTILPTFYDYEEDGSIKTTGVNIAGSEYYQDVLTLPVDLYSKTKRTFGYGFLWLGELYRDVDKETIFGGTSEEAIVNNKWYIGGESINIEDIGKGEEGGDISIRWTEGDTYYQRYDHIKTYPSNLEQLNSVTEILSFMCETKVNLDGRYDTNRGLTSNFTTTPTNANKLNTVYSQDNNYYSYYTLNAHEINPTKFHNTLIWSLAKSSGNQTDTWAAITTASALELDGDKGELRALRRLNNDLIAFQDTGISQILYNETVQLATENGVPIEIANSGKVQGKRYLSNTVGCHNKWSLCKTPMGLYFIDDISKDLYLFSGQLENVSDSLGFHSWINANVEKAIWDPKNFKGFVSYYDKVNDDVFFISKDYCLAFSETLKQFSSFYSYENTPYFCDVDDIALWIKNNKLWIHNEGDYNYFFGNDATHYKPFYTEVIVNPDINEDKVFNTLEFRADTFDTNNKLLNTTFDQLEVWNEYQHAIEDLSFNRYKPSNLKQKFRTWRVNIPRDEANGKDRMRNPWLYLKLSKITPNKDKTILHDLLVQYYQ